MKKWSPSLGFWERRGIPEPTQEYKFYASRKWRFDFAWLDEYVAVEVEGGIWVRGRHTRGKGYLADMEKYNEAVLLGWKILRYPPDVMESVKVAASIRKLIFNNRERN